MIVHKITRSYSKSINLKNYSLPESWIKIKATYEAICESGDDAVKVSEMLASQAQTDVVNRVKEIVAKIEAARAPVAPVAPVNPAPVAPTAPVAPVNPAPAPAPAAAPTVTQPRPL